MKNKKGFTLIELLAVVVIIGILAILIVPNAFNIIDKSKTDSYNTLVNYIENSASLYVSRHRDEIKDLLDVNDQYTITIQALVDEDLVKQPLVDPRTEQAISGNIIVTFTNDQDFNVCYDDGDC